MDIWIGFAVAALKAGVSGAVRNGIVQALADQGINIGSDKLRRYLEKSQEELSQVLTDKSLLEMNVPKEYIAYVKAEIKGLLRSVSLDEDLFRNCRYDGKSLAEALYKKYKRQKKDFVECESEIQKVLNAMSEKAISLEKEREGFTEDSLVYLMKNEDDQMELLRKILHTLDEFMKIGMTNSEKGREPERKKRLPDRTEEYSSKWNENMFLNDFDEDDDNAGVNIRLSELYQLPFYRLKENKKDISELQQRLERCTNTTERKRRMLLILGQPGMGKSTLITWFADKYKKKQDQNKRELLVYRFIDFNIDWSFNGNGERKSVDSAILESLNMEKEDLNGKILILDGFDEVAVSNRTAVLNQLYNAWTADAHIKDFALLITCRENYIEDLSRLSFPYITLQPWNENQIESFCSKYELLTKSRISEPAINKMKEMKNIFGIPIILYMTLALEITVREESSVVEIYDQIFSLAGGIYDRSLKKDASIRWDDEHRITRVKKQIHQFSREISMWMFENNPQKAAIPRQEYEKIRDNIFEKENCIDELQKRDVLIGNYFQRVRYYDGVDTEQLTFVHRSIYEYFVAETIYSEGREAIVEMTVEAQEKFAGMLGYRLKAGRIDYNIGQYLKTKVNMLLETLSKEKRNKFYAWVEETVGKMLDMGMLYFTEKNIKEYKNVIEKEMKCFLNLLHILRLFLDFSDRIYILEEAKQRQIRLYIRYLTSLTSEGADIVVDLSKIDLHGTNLNGADMFGVNLSSGNLQRISLSEAYLRGAILNSADLSWANLRGAVLSRAEMIAANLSNANLSNTNLRGVFFNNADLRGINLDGTELNETVIDQSIWEREDVDKYINIILQSEFEGIYICSDKMSWVTREELLSQYSN